MRRGQEMCSSVPGEIIHITTDYTNSSYLTMMTNHVLAALRSQSLEYLGKHFFSLPFYNKKKNHIPWHDFFFICFNLDDHHLTWLWNKENKNSGLSKQFWAKVNFFGQKDICFTQTWEELESQSQKRLLTWQLLIKQSLASLTRTPSHRSVLFADCCVKMFSDRNSRAR